MFIVLVLFIFNFLLTTIAKDYVDNEVLVCGKYDLIVRLGIKVVHLIAALFGVVAVYGVSNLYLNKHNGVVPKALEYLNPFCFGVYLSQQFVLQILYYKTPLFASVGPYFAPWIALFVTIIVSFSLTYLIRLSKAGRFLLG